MYSIYLDLSLISHSTTYTIPITKAAMDISPSRILACCHLVSRLSTG